MDNQIEKISKLMKEVKNKVEKIASHNVSIKEFNFKLEALLTAFESYTTYDSPSTENTCENIANSVLCSSDAPKREISRKGKRSATEQDTGSEASILKSASDSTYISREESLGEFIRRMEICLPNNKLLRSNAVKIAECLYSNREGMLLEGIMRNTGVSKYRCVDILNTMLKTDPPLLSKKFDKGFIYSIVLL